MLFTATKVVAIIGWSTNPERPSHWIADYLEANSGWKVYRINPLAASSPGPQGDVPVYADLESLPEQVDIVDVFRKPDAVPAIVADAIVHGAKGVWLQP
jgi:predicted CoA-binding protein